MKEEELKKDMMSFKPESEMTLREKVISRRKNAKITQTELAEKTGLTQSQLSEFESGKSDLTSSSLDKIFNVLKLKYSQNAEEQWELAGICAEEIKNRGIVDVKSISKEEMAEIGKNEEILLLQVIGKKLYNSYVDARIIDEKNTYNYFLTLVNFRYACKKKDSSL